MALYPLNEWLPEDCTVDPHGWATDLEFCEPGGGPEEWEVLEV